VATRYDVSQAHRGSLVPDIWVAQDEYPSLVVQVLTDLAHRPGSPTRRSMAVDHESPLRRFKMTERHPSQEITRAM
jgi:hypothetical protein